MASAVTTGIHGAIGNRKRNTPSSLNQAHEHDYHSSVMMMQPTSTTPTFDSAAVDSWFANMKISIEDESDHSRSNCWTQSPMSRQSSSPAPTISNRIHRILDESLTASPFYNPSISAIISDEDPAFRNDLARILVWFLEDLTGQQRLSAVFTLAKELPKWQLEVLSKFLDQEAYSREVEKAEGFNINDPPSSWNTLACPVPIRYPIPSRDTPSLSNSVPSMLNETSPSDQSTPTTDALGQVPHPSVNGVENIPVNAKLYYSDFHAWLKYHRLHKYADKFPPHLIRDRIFIAELTDARLEELGVSALGARRKFNRLFQLIRESPSD